MSKARSWSVKGVDQDTRSLARRASKAAGMTIGGWVDHAIRQAAFKAAQDAERQRIMAAASYPVAPSRTFEPGERQMPTSPSEMLERALAAARAAPPAARNEPGEAEAAGVRYDADEPPSGVPEAFDEALPREPSAVSAEHPDTAGRARYTRPLIVGLVALATVAAAGGTLWWVSASNVEQVLNRASPAPRAGQTATDRPAAPGPVAAAPRPASPRSAPGPASEALALPPQPPGEAPPATMTEIQRLLGAARQGSPEAQLALARAYATGDGIAKDQVAANRWFERAATQGLTAAQLALAERLAGGIGASGDAALAAFWYRKAADNGDAVAAFRLGRAYGEGHGVQRSVESALRWYERAAAAGDAEAMMALAKMYEDGVGVPRDAARAAALYRSAAFAGSAGARERLSRLADAPPRPPAAPQPEAAPKPRPAATPARPTVASRMPSAAPETPKAAVAAPRPKVVSPPPRTAAAPQSPATAGRMPKTAVAEIQRLLGRLDFQPGPPDGSLGPRTVKAIRQYQVFAGLQANGVASPALLEELREIVRTLPAKPKPVSR